MTRQSGKFKFFWLLGVLLLVVMWSCYPGGPESSFEQDVALSYYDDAYNFAGVRTYAMPDEVFLREGSDDVDTSLNDHVLEILGGTIRARRHHLQRGVADTRRRGKVAVSPGHLVRFIEPVFQKDRL